MKEMKEVRRLRGKVQILNKYSSNFHKKIIENHQIDLGIFHKKLVSFDKSKLTKTLIAYHSAAKTTETSEVNPVDLI
jgi:hypothetical protein